MREHCPHCAYSYEVIPAQCALCHRRLNHGILLPFIGRSREIEELLSLSEELKQTQKVGLIGVHASSGGGVGALIQQVTLRISRPPFGFRQVNAHPFTLNVTRTPSHIPMVFQRVLESLFRIDLKESAQERERWAVRQLTAMNPPKRVKDAFYALWSEPIKKYSTPFRALEMQVDFGDDEDDLETVELSQAQLSATIAQPSSLLPLSFDTFSELREDDPTHPPKAQATEMGGLSELTTLISFFAQKSPISLSFYDLQNSPQKDLEAIRDLVRNLQSIEAPILLFFERPPALLKSYLHRLYALSALTFEDLTELLSEAFPYTEDPIAFVERLMKRSEGHPATVVQALVQSSQGKESHLELRRSSPPLNQALSKGSIRDLLTFASIIGPTFSLSQVYLIARSFETRPWSELPPKQEDDWRDLLDLALQEELVSKTQHQRLINEPSYRFCSAELKEGYVRLWSGQFREQDRRYAHRLLAEWMSTQEYTPEAQVQIGLSIAEHWREGGALLEASRVSLEVGELLLKKGNHKLAYSALQQAEQFLEGQGIWRKQRRLYTLLARAATYLGQPHEAESILQQALKRAWQLEDLSTAYELGQQLYDLYKTRGFGSQATWIGEWLSSLPREAQYEHGRGESAIFDTFEARVERSLPQLYDLPLPTFSTPKNNHHSSIPPLESPQLWVRAEEKNQTIRKFTMNHISDLAPPPSPVMYVLQTLQNAGYEAWVVGGSVRDRLLGRTVSDWDLTTSAMPQEVIPYFKRVIETGIAHGTVTVVQDGLNIEVTTYRIDGDYRDGRRPDHVTFTRSLKEDLARRDFTMNAMAWDPNQQRIEDPFGGREHLKQALISAVGMPLKRLREDGLRSLRAIRFASVLGFEIEPETWKAIQNSLDIFQGVAMERIQVELFKTLVSAEAGRGLNALKESQMLAHIAPEIDELSSAEFQLICAAIGRSHAQLETRLAVLFSCCSQPDQIVQDRLSILKCSKKLIQQVSHLLRWAEIRPSTERTDGQVRALVAQIGLGQLSALVSVRSALADVLGEEQESRAWVSFQERVQSLKVDESPQGPRDLAVRGSDLTQRFNIPPSKAIGELLNALLHHVWEYPEDNQVERLLALTPKFARELGIEIG